MSTIINTRSPYYITYNNEPLATNVEITMYIWSGVETSVPLTSSYVISKATNTPSTGNPYASFEISELIRDYLYTEYYNENDTVDALWVEVDAEITLSSGTPVTQTDTFLAIDGYGYFEEGINPRTSIDPTDDSYTPMLLQDNLNVYFVKGEIITFPVFSETSPTIDFTFTGGGGVSPEWQVVDFYWGTYAPVWNAGTTDIQITDNTNSEDKIHYIAITDTQGIETGDTALITATTGSTPFQSQTVTFIELCETKYTPIKMMFYNKYGAIQELWATKKSQISLNTSSENFKANTVDLVAQSYSTYKHGKKRFDVNGQENIVVSTDFLDEDVNEPMKQMLLSEQIWIDSGTVVPMIIKTSDFVEKTGVNDKLISYTIAFEYAFNKVQNIR